MPLTDAVVARRCPDRPVTADPDPLDEWWIFKKTVTDATAMTTATIPPVRNLRRLRGPIDRADASLPPRTLIVGTPRK